MEQITSTVSVEVQTEDADAHTQSSMITSSQTEEATRINDSNITLDNTAQITSSASIEVQTENVDVHTQSSIITLSQAE